MRLATTAGVVAVLACGGAQAGPNLVSNGGFEQSAYSVSTEFGAAFGGQGVTGWRSDGADAFNLYFLPGNATTVSAVNRFNDPGNKLAASFTGASPSGGNFVALDGDSDFSGPLTQAVSGLVAGAKYDLSFSWAATQLQNRTGDTTERLQVSLGSQTFTTPTVAIPTQGFSGWLSQVFTFTAASTTGVLSFLSIGTPAGLPPIALLDGVSLTEVPEPATMALLAAGLAGVGLVRRRA